MKQKLMKVIGNFLKIFFSLVNAALVAQSKQILIKTNKIVFLINLLYSNILLLN